MADAASHKPKDYKAIMLSSTFRDSMEHRVRAIAAREFNETNAAEPIDHLFIMDDEHPVKKTNPIRWANTDASAYRAVSVVCTGDPR